MKQMISNGGSASMARRGIRLRAASSGFSLTEVLVALAILIVGIFALIELFPPGFFTLQIAANETAANRLGQAEIEQLSANNLNQLGSVYALGVLNGGNSVYDSIDDDDLHVQHDTTLGLTSDIDAERAIQGETVRIPPAVQVYPGGNTANAPEQLSVYVLNFAPIQITSNFVGDEINPQTGALQNTSAPQLANDNFVLKVGGLPWTRTVGDSRVSLLATVGNNNGNPNYSDPNALPPNDAPQYLIDYNQMEIAVGPEFTTPAQTPNNPTWYPQPFNFTVQGANSTGTVQTYNAQFIWDPTNTLYYVTGTGNNAGCQWFPIPIGNWTDANGNPIAAPVSWQPGTDKLWRDFHIVYNAITAAGNQDLATYLNSLGKTFSAAFSPDPYSYAISEPPISTKSDIGAIAFNPTAALIKDANGNPLMATISYNTYDWHIIHEDHTLGNVGQQQPTVRLTLDHIYQLGDAQSDNTPYGGIVPLMSNATGLDVVNLDTGQSSADVTAPPALSPTGFDSNNGVVSFPTTAIGDHVRVFYRAQGDWGLSVIKAAQFYTQRAYPTATNSDPAPPDTAAPTQAAPAAGFPIPPAGTYEIEIVNGNPTTRLLFPGTDIGKMVHIENVLGSNGVTYHDANVRTIQPDPVSAYTVVMNGRNIVEHLYGVVNLASDPKNINAPDGYLGVLPANVTINSSTSVGPVVGASITARVIWKERTTWKDRDITSLIGSQQQAGG